ncbi:MAG TPA: TIGR03435 family protein [Bryobacteraceae bacterium]|nr:TIGR03435 family protein [Bryobacteraceae bacterium]
MRKFVRSILALVAASGCALFAQDITGIWQGTLQIPQKDLRIVIKISKADQGGALKAVLYSIDQGAPGLAGTVSLQASVAKISIPGAGATYEGKLDSDGVNLAGTFNQGPAKLALNLKHVKPDEAWPTPEPSARLKAMAADAPLAFEVATIKPSKPGAQGKGITMRGPREFITINTSLNDLITFAYGIHVRQISGGPAWLESDLYDITAKPEAEGLANRQQLEGMLRKLLADRFQFAFHRDKKELSVYAIVMGKTGAKLTKSEGDPNGLPGLGFRQLGQLAAQNANMNDFAGLMQSTVLERPVVDQTGLTGRFDFTLNWTPDEFQFAGLGVKVPPPSEKPDAPPDLFTAIQQQMGLRLEGTKALVEIFVIDKVEKPSAN